MNCVRDFLRRAAWLPVFALSSGGLAQPPATPPASSAPAAQPSAAGRQERPIEIFAMLPRFTDARLSPDGTRLAVKTRIQDQQVLAIVSLTEPDARPAFVAADEAVDINSWSWVNDDWLVVRVGTRDEYEGQEIYVSRLLGIDRQARTMNRLGWQNAAQLADDIVWIARDGSPRLLFAMQTAFYGPNFWPKVYEADVSTGRLRQVVGGRDHVMNWFADPRGTVRMGYGYDDETGAARLLYRAGPDDSFQTIARANVRREESVPMPAMFLPDSSRAIAISDRDGFDAVYEMSLPDLALGRRLFAVEGYDVEGLYPTSAGDRISGISYTTQRATTAWRDLPMRQAQANLDVTFGEGHARIISWSRDRSRLLVLVGRPN